MLTLYRWVGLEVEAFVEVLYRARTITKERAAAIRAKPVGGGLMPVKPKMAYYFAVLEDLLGLKPDATTRPPAPGQGLQPFSRSTPQGTFERPTSSKMRIGRAAKTTPMPANREPCT